MMNLSGFFAILLLLVVLIFAIDVNGFQPSAIHNRPSSTSTSSTSSTLLKVIVGDNEPILEKTQRILQQTSPPFDPQLDATVKSIFGPQAMTSSDFEYRVVAALAARGFSTQNTLLATSLCSDELAKQLTDDFVSIYGSNFNIGGLAGFPFAGNVGFQTMTGHIPDSGFCLFLYAPHVGLSRDGTLGMVERDGVAIHDSSCCTSAIEACKHVMAGGAAAAGGFTDLQQSAVQDQLSSVADRLQASQAPMLELPYAIFERQTQLVNGIVQDGMGGIKEGIALVGGIQINTGPNTMDYFHPLRFDLINGRGELVENMMPFLQ